MSEIKSNVTIQFETGTVTKDIEKIQTVADKVTTSITKEFGCIVDGIKSLKSCFDNISEPIGNLANSFQSVSDWDVGAVTEKITGIVTALETLNKQLAAQKEQELWTSFLSPVATILQTAQAVYAQEVNRPKGKYESGKKKLYGGTKGKFSAGDKDGITSGIASMDGFIPDAESIIAAKEAIGDLVGTMKQSAGAWIAQTGAKIADKAVDLQIMALYAVDYVKAFGATIAQIAASTGAWIANTAAKVASTAAQWAQIAATTAWNALCTAATAVTTAFGAAITFLTSPIGLVILAIGALIAIVVLLVKNWDTVKAAVLTAWEAIKGALATAAEWLNTNLLQPVIGFFTLAMDWITEKVQAGFAFVQSIFAKVGEFLQGAFAKDWTEQFGAVGNVLNAFFANIQNIWNAVKSIFSGIVSFVGAGSVLCGSKAENCFPGCEDGR